MVDNEKDKAMDIPILDVKNLSKQYGDSRGIRDVSLTIEKGDIFGFIGPNGSGKSTTIRSILGLIFPDSGEVTLFGEDGLQNGAKLRSRIGFVPSELNYYDGLSVLDLLKYSASFYSDSVLGKIDYYAQKLKLDLGRKITDLSLGNRKKVAIIQALIHQPELLILDEPTSGLDPLIQSRFYDILKEEQARGCTIFFSSHTLSEVERLCNKVGIIRDGKIITVSRIDELKKIYLKRFRLIFELGTGPNYIKDIFLDSNLLETDSLGKQNIRNLKIEGNIAEGFFAGEITDLLKKTASLPLLDIVIDDPNLEEIFMHFYDDPTGIFPNNKYENTQNEKIEGEE